jgi:PEGA domain
MSNFKTFILVPFAAMSISGCATIMNGPNQTMEIDTDPGGSNVTLTGGAVCVTPCKLEVPRKNDLRVDIQHEGYQPVYVLIQSKLGGATFGNILAGGIIGSVVDSSNGSSKQLKPNPLKIRLVPVGATGEAMLLDKKGKDVGPVSAHNDKVRGDVAKTIGAEAAGLAPPTPAAITPDPVPSPAPASN